MRRSKSWRPSSPLSVLRRTAPACSRMRPARLVSMCVIASTMCRRWYPPIRPRASGTTIAKRGTAIETDPVQAIRSIQLLRIKVMVGRWSMRLDEPICVISTVAHGGVMLSGMSTLARELAFVLNHTIHHQAMIGLLASLHGCDRAGRLRIRAVHAATLGGEPPCAPYRSSHTADGCRVVCNRDERRATCGGPPTASVADRGVVGDVSAGSGERRHVDRRQRRRAGGCAAEPNGDCERAPLVVAEPGLDRADAADVPVDRSCGERVRGARRSTIRAVPDCDGAAFDRGRDPGRSTAVSRRVLVLSCGR